MEVKILGVDQSSAADRLKLCRLADLLDFCYGSASVGRAKHLSRILTKGTLLFAASSAGSIVGVSYVHSTGKRGALGVLPDSRGYGVGTALVSRSLVCLPIQFTEIEEQAGRLLAFYTRLGFVMVKDPDYVARCFEQTPALIEQMEVRSDRVTYRRRSLHDPAKVRTYVMLTSPEKRL